MRNFSWIALAAIMVGAAGARADIVSIDPNNYAAGANVSSVAPGAMLSAVSYVPNPDPTGPIRQSYVPQFSSVFAQAVTSDCTYGNVFGQAPCSPSGSKVFGYAPVSAPSPSVILWGDEVTGMHCAVGECGPGQAPYVQDDYPTFRVDFTHPTNYVSVLLGYYTSDGGILDAFNSQNQLVAECSGDTIQGFTYDQGGHFTFSSNCGSIYPTTQTSRDWAQFSISDPNNDISYIQAGGDDYFAAVGHLQYDVPEPGTLALFGLGLAGLIWSKRRGTART